MQATTVVEARFHSRSTIRTGEECNDPGRCAPCIPSPLPAGTVVANSKYYEDTSGNILNEICELVSRCLHRLAARMTLRAGRGRGRGNCELRSSLHGGNSSTRAQAGGYCA